MQSYHLLNFLLNPMALLQITQGADQAYIEFPQNTTMAALTVMANNTTELAAKI